jgi:excisionase family DNA binding protein
MSVRDVATVYAVPRGTVYAAIRRRELPAVRAFGVPPTALR